MDYTESLAILEELKVEGIKPGLVNTKTLLDALDFRFDGVVVHVAGTNGKGSTAATLDAILRENGLKTALYTSPELLDFRERIRVDGEMISKDTFSKISGEIQSALESSGITPTFFEATTVLALKHFADSKVDVMILEVGMGGRLDATRNVLDSKVCVVTSIGLDHQKFLGETIEEIAFEKAGIVKENSVCVTACESPALDVLEKTCEEKNSKLIQVKPMISEVNSSVDGISFKLKTSENEYELSSSLRGRFQAENIACAVVVAENLDVPKKIIEIGVSKTRWPGRLDIVQKNPLVILDCAHNPAGLTKTMEFIKTLDYEKLIVVCGFSDDKNVKEMLGILSTADELILTSSKNEKALDPEKIINLISDGLPKESAAKHVVKGVKNALDEALANVGENDLVLVTGSIFVVGAAIGMWRDKI